MITYQSSSMQFSITLQADRIGNKDVLFTTYRSMMRVKLENPNKQMIKVHLFAGGGSTEEWHADYYTDTSGVLEVPLRSYVRGEYGIAQIQAYTNPNITISLTFSNVLGGTPLTDSFSQLFFIHDGVAYADLDAPRRKDDAPWLAALGHEYILPPNVMYRVANGNGIVVETNFGSYGGSSTLGLTWSKIENGTSSSMQFNGTRLNELWTNPRQAVQDNTSAIVLTDGTTTKRWDIQLADGCSDMVLIRWKSLQGARRQHYFPIVAWTNGTDGELSMTSVANGYKVKKNASKGCRCKISGLTAYGVWYYQDLIVSSDVHAIVRPSYSIFETEINSEITRVYVEGGSTETPTGVGFFDFEFNVKFQHYDEF